MNSTGARVRTQLALVLVVGCFMVVAADRSGLLPAVSPFAGELYAWAVILAATALLLGVISVLWLHLRRIQSGQRGWWQSLTLVAVMVAVIVAGMVDASADRSPFVEWVFDSLIAPGYAALFALLAIFVAAAIYQMVHIGRRGGAWVLAGLLAAIVAQTPAAASLAPPNLISGLRWLIDVPVSASMRGVLLGVGLGLLAIAFRSILGRRA